MTGPEIRAAQWEATVYSMACEHGRMRSPLTARCTVRAACAFLLLGLLFSVFHRPNLSHVTILYRLKEHQHFLEE